MKGCAPGSGLRPSIHGPKAVPGAEPIPFYSVPGEAKPRRTSGGKAGKKALLGQSSRMQTVPAQEVQIAAPSVVANAGAKQNLWQRVCAALFEPVDISFLVFFRIVFGGIMLWEVYRYFSYGWITRYFVEPALTFTYYGFSWVKPWLGSGMYIHFVVLGVAAACVMLGLFYRIAAPVFFLAFTYFFLLEQTRYLNHFYLVCLISFLMCFLPAERAFSIDALLRRKIRSDVVPAWTLWLLRSEEHTSELQSPCNLVCRLLLEKKKKKRNKE